MNNTVKVSAVVVTFNRKDTLLQCLNAIELQSLKPENVFILDNASTDGTQQLLKDHGYIDTLKYNIKFNYIRNDKNEGGAGGFYRGMKIAHETDNDNALWVMDDDGIPDKDCLKNLLPYLSDYDYISPLVVDIENEEMTSFMGCTVSDFIRGKENGIVKNCANPFNGILYSSKLIKSIGYPKKEMFIWGDEINYDLRAREKGFCPIVVINAIHRHPLNRQLSVRYLGKRSMTISDKDWKLFCYIRNKTYNNRKFKGTTNSMKEMISDYFRFCCYYLLQCHQPKKMKIVTEAMIKGFRSDFTGLDKYMK
jgi:rhamnopyranosyl-N-acetylglucosaminyl-diphospho-decaprenol beta-1,3/1,4-galactofuranosyltransferase